MPWDMMVFLSITTAGFGYSVHRMVNTPSVALEAKREIASTPITSAAVRKPVVDLGCIERRIGGEKLRTSRESIRFKGRFCNLSRRAMRSFQGIRIRNESNGFEGTAFLHSADPSFVSDEVSLQRGRNEIRVEWVEQNGSPSRQWTAEVTEE